MFRRVLLSAIAAVAIGAASAASAQTYPDKPVKLIVPFPPGGPIDTMGRLVADHLTKGLGQQVVVENRPGAGSTIGYKAVASADPDGYTLLFGSSGSLATAPALYPSLKLDPLKQFAPVASVSLLPMIMVVPPQVPANSVAEFIAYAKANPGKLNFGAGLGTPPHLVGALFVNKTGIDVTYVPYKGAAQAVTDLIAGRNHFIIDGTVILLPLVRAGKLKPIAMARPERWPEFPNVPTLVELGYPDFVLDAWTGVVAPIGTPAPIVARLNAIINEGLRTPETKAVMDRFSSITKIGSPKEFSDFIADQGKRWGDLVRLAGAKAE
jgi:tripartite-type tricarboxylate transporter receptor subunit TctC